MYKYVNIKKVLNFVPSGLLQEESESTILKWALRGYINNVRNKNTREQSFLGISKIKDYKASLPNGFKGIYDACYFDTFPKDVFKTGENGGNNTIYLQDNFDGNKVTVFQAIVFTQIYHRGTAMRYAGQNKDLVYNKCLTLLCQDCINFSISRDYTTMTIDMEEGYVAYLYQSTIQDEVGNFLVPDDIELLQGLAYFAEAMHYQDRRFRKDQGANQLFIETLQMANASFSEFQKRDLFRKFNPDNYVRSTQTPSQIPLIDYLNDRTNEYKGY